MSTSAHHFVDAPFSLQVVALAVLGGSTITLMSRMQQGTEDDAARIVATVIGGFLLAGLQLFHSGAAIGYGRWLAWFGYTVVSDMPGGIVLVTLLRLVRTEELIAQSRAEAPADPEAPHG
ncbi:hypothetical protein [Arthrobacter sp. B0490]|uniref:hypothetical protein n=1 Tax=Arthrobacter sp. B0490 TaxID=2058891 RepID=UPI0015E295A6|nr:hypothetical protein [Arthrobacter sp. B0490]